jgi:hypothetical protein
MFKMIQENWYYLALRENTINLIANLGYISKIFW